MRLSRPFYRLPILFDAARLQQEVAAFPADAWVSHPNGIPGNSALRLITVGGGENDDVDGVMEPTEHLRRSPYLRQVLASFGVVWSRSRLMKLAAQSQVPEHADINYHWYYRVRLHIPVVTLPAVQFRCGGESVHMAAGEAWIFDNWRRHSVVNSTDEDRIHLVADTTGSSAFWQLVAQGQLAQRSIAQGATAPGQGQMADAREPLSHSQSGASLLEHRYDPARLDVMPMLERTRLAPVMPPGEIDLLVLDLRAELVTQAERADLAPRLPQYHGLLDAFRRDWRQLYALYGESAAGWPHYAALRAQVRASSREIGDGLCMRTNQIPVHRVLEGRLLRAILPAVPENPHGGAQTSSRTVEHEARRGGTGVSAGWQESSQEGAQTSWRSGAQEPWRGGAAPASGVGGQLAQDGNTRSGEVSAGRRGVGAGAGVTAEAGVAAGAGVTAEAGVAAGVRLAAAPGLGASLGVAAGQLRLQRPVFIIAAPRSGSTLLFETLASSGRLCTLGGEAHWLIEDIEALRPGAPGVESNRLTAEHATDQYAARILTTISQRLRDADNNPVPFRPEVRFLEKTPKNSLRIPFLNRIFPDALFVFLWRDAPENLSSIIEAWRSGRWKTYNGLDGFDGPWSLLLPPNWRAMNGRPLEEIAAFQWTSANRIALDDLQQLPRERWTSVRYRDFLAQPEAEVGRLCSFISIDMDGRLLERVRHPLPLSRFTQTPPDENKWKGNASLIERVLPQVAPVWKRLQALESVGSGRD